MEYESLSRMGLAYINMFMQRGYYLLLSDMILQSKISLDYIQVEEENDLFVH